MPTYDYKCEDCGDIFEAFQSMLDDPLSTCHCEKKSSNIRRLISNNVGIAFKGAGFYVTDGDSKPSKTDC